jgi:integrase
MGVYKRGNIWWVRIGRGIDRSTGTRDRQKALAVEARIRDELWRQKHMGAPARKTWDDAVLRWAEEIGKHKKGWGSDYYRIKILTKSLSGAWVDEIDNARAHAAIPERVSATSRHHYLSLVRRVLRFALKSRMLDRVPTLQFPRLPPGRIRYLSGDEERRLLDALPAHWRDPALFTLQTGVRLGTLRAIRQEWLAESLLVIPGAHTKSGRRLPLPLTSEALRIAHRQPEGVYLFQYEGRQLPRMGSKTWARVVKKSGVEDFRWHDLRHTWASRAVMKGVSLYDLQMLGDWSTPMMVQRYAHLSPDYLRAAVRKLELAQSTHTGADTHKISTGENGFSSSDGSVDS